MVTEKCVLIIDDEYNMMEAALGKNLEYHGFRVVGTPDQKDALGFIESEAPDIILLDVLFPDGESKDTLRKIKDRYPEKPPVIVISDTMLDSRYDALNYQSADARYPKKLMKTKKQIPELVEFMNGIMTQSTGDTDLGFVVGNTRYMKETVVNEIKMAADCDLTVLITGETGTGKEEVAKAIHRLSCRKNSPNIVLNCAAFPDNMIESELFGHEKGAFTGADRKKPGRVVLAEGGTLFLDEIGDITPKCQVKLLRLLQEKTFEPLGGVRTEKADVRIICATNQDLEDMIEEGMFRSDLYHRFNTFTIHLPPLRERLEDIPLLINHFMAKERSFLSDLRDDVKDLLMSYNWPGNIRELKNLTQKAILMAKNDRSFQVMHFPSLTERKGRVKPTILKSAAEIYEALPDTPMRFPEIAEQYGDPIAVEVGILFLKDKKRWPNEEESKSLFDSKAGAVRGWLTGKGITKTCVLPKN